jgi:nucleotide-binding universal stress UspA family protein
MTEPVILLPLDGSQCALNALPVAKAFSALGKAPLHILHVAERAPPLVELAAQLGVSRAELRGATIDARLGEPATAILRAAEESHAHLIVLCTHTKAARPADVLGRTALAVLREAACPVVLVNPDLALGGWALRTVLLPHEGTPTTSDALRPGAELARLAGAELIVLQVAAAGATVPDERGTLGPPRYLDQPQHEWPAWGGEFLQRLACICPLADLQVRLMLARGTPATEILRVASAEAADLIVLVWKGHWEPEHAETLKGVVRDAPCPTMVARL